MTKASCDGRTTGPAPLADGYHVFPPGKILNVVTWLEMRAPPATPIAPPLALRRVVRPDPAWYRALFLRVGTPWLWSMHLELDDAALAEAIADPSLEIFVACEARAEVGLVVLDRGDPRSVEILDFGLVPEATGRGLGRRMMAATLAHAFAGGPERVWLHTCTHDHPAAVPFYLACGFAAYATGVEVLDDPRLAGLLPPDAAPHVPLLRPAGGWLRPAGD
ncbi:GNAT family N-acetyltransferase [Stella sp.]|uniref:GNAT family N-acetyltransferase n=1 Tax=Stella sp. TaxID=2912054 RepID=UPI0035AF9BB7